MTHDNRLAGEGIRKRKKRHPERSQRRTKPEHDRLPRFF
jgi:hypothetical protein